MAKREKVILIMMSVVVAFGIYNFLFSSGAKKKPAVTVTGVAETNKFIADVANSFKDNLTETNMYIIRQARTEWNQDPFVKIELPVKPQVKISTKNEPTTKQVNYTYSGFLKMGERKLAIINGLEYESGEEIERGGYVVKLVEPNRVVLGISGKSGKEDITLFLKEGN